LSVRSGLHQVPNSTFPAFSSPFIHSFSNRLPTPFTTIASSPSAHQSVVGGDNSLLKGVGSRSPPSEENAQADRLEDLGGDADTNGVERALLGENLAEIQRGGGGHEDEATEVGSAFVGQRAGRVDQGADAVGLQRRTNERGAPGDGGRGRLLGLDELLLGVCDLGALVSLAEERGEDLRWLLVESTGGWEILFE
jgi:hypothetical protein